MNNAQVKNWFTAVKNGNLQKVEEFINSGFNINSTTNSENNDNRRNANLPNTPKSKNMTALMHAAQNGFEEMVETLLNADADIDKVDSLGKSALTYACEYLHPDTVEGLINKGAAFDVEDVKGNNLIHSIINGVGEVLSLRLSNETENKKLEDAKKILNQLLSETDIDVNARNNMDDTPLDLLTSIATNHINEEILAIETELTGNGANAALIYDDIIQAFLEEFANAERRNTWFYNDYFQRLIDAGYNIDRQDEKLNTSLIYAAQNGDEYTIRTLLHFDADPNITNEEGKSALYYVANWGNEELVRLLLEHNAEINDVIRDAYFSDRFTDSVKALLQPLIGDEAPPNQNQNNDSGPRWKGWSSADIQNYTSVFEPQAEANNIAICPVCLKFTYREDGCMYMSHNCKTIPGYYHRALYNKYRNPQGLIFFCTICGRICKEHSHYHLAQPGDDKPALWSSGEPFQNDCRLTNHGGGVPEKVARFSAIREKALELNAQIDQISKIQALNQIVEAGWSAPLDPVQMEKATRQLEQRQFNRPNTNFPAAIDDEEVNENALPNIVSPNANMRPLLHRFGENAISRNDVNQNSYQNAAEPDKLIQFRHRRQDGTINNHANEWVSRDTLQYAIEQQVRNFNTDESSGFCVFYPACNAYLYPEEIRGLIPDELYQQYRRKFNYKFRNMAGGYRKNNANMANKPPIFIEITDGACLLPQSKRAVKNAKLGGNKKTKTKTKSGGKKVWKTRRQAKLRKTLKQRLDKRFKQTRRK